MLVCWKGGPSPIHNLDELYVKEITGLQEGKIHLINDEIGLHKMETIDENQQAITLHCYSPPYLDCFTFDLENGAIKTNIAHTTYDTEFGIKRKIKNVILLIK
jgi:hypothetical protein